MVKSAKTTISLSFYIIKINEKRKKEHLKLGDLKGETLFNLAVKYCKFRQGDTATSPELNKSLKISQKTFCENSQQNIIHGTIFAGEYGKNAQGINIKTGEHAYNRTIDIAEQVELYFMLYLPENLDYGFAIFQTYGQMGIKTLVAVDFQQFLNKFYNDIYTCKINPTLPSFLLDQKVNSSTVKKVIFSGLCHPSSDIDALKRDYNPQMQQKFDYPFELSITPPNYSLKHILNIAKNSISKQRAKKDTIHELKQILYIDNDKESSFEFDEAKLKVNIGGKERVLKFGGSKCLTADYDITDVINYDDNGNPDFKLIHHQAISLLEEMKTSYSG